MIESIEKAPRAGQNFDLLTYAQTLRHRAMIDEATLQEATADALHSLASADGEILRQFVAKNPSAERLLIAVTYNLVIASSLAKSVIFEGDFAHMWRNLRLQPEGIESKDVDTYERAYFDLEVLTIQQGRDELQKMAGVPANVVIDRLVAMRNYAGAVRR